MKQSYKVLYYFVKNRIGSRTIAFNEKLFQLYLKFDGENYFVNIFYPSWNHIKGHVPHIHWIKSPITSRLPYAKRIMYEC